MTTTAEALELAEQNLCQLLNVPARGEGKETAAQRRSNIAQVERYIEQCRRDLATEEARIPETWRPPAHAPHRPRRGRRPRQGR